MASYTKRFICLIHRTLHRTFHGQNYSGKMVSLKIYLIVYFLAATRSIHGYNYAVHLGDLRGGFERGVTRGAMRGGGLVSGLVGVGLGGNSLASEGFLTRLDGFGRVVNSRVINARPLGSTAGRVGGLEGSALGGIRRIIGPLNAGLRSRENGAIGGVGIVDGGAPGGASGRGGEFNSGALIDERGRLGASVGVQGLNGGAFSGNGRSEGGIKVVVLNGGIGGFDGGLTGGRFRGDRDSSNGAGSFGDRENNIDQNGGFGNLGSSGGIRDFNEGALGSWDINSNGVFGGISRSANMLNGPAISGLVNRDQANNVDFNGQFGRLGRSNGGVNGLLGNAIRKGRISGGFDDGATGGTFTGGLGNGGADTGLGGTGGFSGGVNDRAFNGGFRRFASGMADASRGADRRELVGESGSRQGVNDATLFNRLASVTGVRGLNDGVLGDGGAVGGLKGSGNVLKVVVVNGGFGGPDGRSAGGVASSEGDSNIGTGAQRRRLESSDQTVGFGNLGSNVGDGGRVSNRGGISAGGGLETRSSESILTNLLRIVSNVVNGLGGVADVRLGDLGSNGRFGGTSSTFNGGNGLDDPTNNGFANGGSSSAIGLGGEFGRAGGLFGGVDALLGRGLNKGRKY
ncbi:hypothetical protein CHS0354_022239 [Potamilus streckersoni]|uniref:Uncharacterized protein n=1 Tax=Potamilus streckersoni TaxID=2493646 RepID=A0AAE0WCE5_9BIVA|nr:hypothetical protein CHS0354_022239 [Potamilus streckersoni]